MANISRVKTWSAGETLTAADLNAEFNNILSGVNSNNLDADNLDPTDGYTFGTVVIGAGLSSPDGKFHIYQGNASTTAVAAAAQAVIEHSGNAGLSILTGATSTGNIYFGDSGDADAGRIVYDHNAPDMSFFVEATEVLTLAATGLTVGVDDTGYDVKFFGASAGAFAYWDETNDLLDLRGATAAGPGHLKLTTGELTNVDGGVLGRIDFQAPLDSAGTDAILVAASIWAEADATFSASVNTTDLVFAAATSETATAIMRMSKGALYPATDDALDLGITNTYEWSNAYWASGAVFGWNNSDMTLTHSANTLTVAGGTFATAALTATTITGSGVLSIDDTTDTSSTTTGSIQTDGGVGIAKALWVGTTSRLVGVTTHGGNIVSDTDSTDDLGTTGVRWANIFVDAATITNNATIGGTLGVTGALTATGGVDGVLGGVTPAAATVTTLTASGKIVGGAAAKVGSVHELLFSGSDILDLVSTDAVAANIGGGMRFGGNYTGSTATTWAAIKGLKENATDGQFGGYLTLNTRANGGSMTEQVRVTSDGSVGIGTASPRASGGFNAARLNIEAGDASFAAGAMFASNSQTAADGPILDLARSGGTTVGSNTIVADDYILGRVRFIPADGVDLRVIGAEIRATVQDATPAANQIGAELGFYTNDSTDEDPELAMTIDSSQNVGIGTASPGTTLEVGDGSAADQEFITINGGSDAGKGGGIAFERGGTATFYISDVAAIQGGAETSSDVAIYALTGNGTRFYTNGNNERMRLDSSGNLGIGITSTGARLDARNSGTTKGDVITVGTASEGILGNIGVQGTSPYRMYLGYGGSGSEIISIMSGGLVGINETTNANMTQGLTINQGANDDEIIAFKSSDVAHGLTSVAETDTYGYIVKSLVDGGGIRIVGISDVDATTGNYTTTIDGFTADTALDTTKSTAAGAAVIVRAAITDGGTSVTTPGANENLFTIGAFNTVRFIFDSDGDSHQDVGTAWTNFDDEPDALITRSLGIVMDEASIIKTKYDDWNRDHKADLERTGIIPKLTAEQIENGERPLVNTTQVMRLHNGAIWQLYSELQELKEENLQLKEALQTKGLLN